MFDLYIMIKHIDSDDYNAEINLNI